jgi:three-Cys-motif partner protein
MQQQNWSLHYVDAFAGQGKQQLKLVASDSDAQSENQASFDLIDQAEDETRLEFLEGSALRALKVSDEARRGFDQFIFIEASRKAKEKLAQRALVEWPAQAAKIKLLKDDANDAIVDYVKNTNWSKTRALVFLDPFGLQVRWRTIEELAQTRACDVWYLFPIPAPGL